MVLTSLENTMPSPFNKVVKSRKREMHIAHHCTPNVMYASILSHTR